MKLKLENIKTGVVKEIEKSLASDYIATKEWKLVEEKKVTSNFYKKQEKKEEEVTENE